MTDLSVRQTPSAGAISAEHYQTFEMAKANDDILGGDNIAQIRSYAAYARAQAQAIHKTIAATSGIDDVAAIKAEAIETEQTFAKVGIYADQRIGEILRELPTNRSFHGNQHQEVNCDAPQNTKSEAIKQAHIDSRTAYDLQALAANPDVVEAVIARAEAEGRIPSRKQVTDEIRRIKAEKEQTEDALRQAERERNLAERERDAARESLADAYRTNESLEDENERLRNQPKPAPEVVVKEVEPQDYRATIRRNQELEHRCNIATETNKNLRKQLDKAKDDLKKEREISGAAQKMQEVRRDVQYLTSATNTYIREYGGLTWTVQQLAQVDETTLNQLKTAAMNLAAFSSALVSSIDEFGKK